MSLLTHIFVPSGHEANEGRGIVSDLSDEFEWV